MKKIFTLAAAVTMLWSCSKEDSILTPDENETASLQIETTVLSRASRATKVENGNTTVTGPVLESTLPNGSKIGVTVYNVDTTTNYQGLADSVSNNLLWTANESKWTPAKPFYLQNRGADIYGYFPYNAEAKNMFAIPVAPGYVDYLRGKSSNSVSKVYPNAAIVMNHALAMISFTFQRTNYPGECKLQAITLNNLPNAGTMNLTNGAITTADTKASFNVLHYNGTNYAGDNWSNITIPANGILGTVNSAPSNVVTTAPAFHALVLPATDLPSDTATLNASIVIDGATYTVALNIISGGNDWLPAKHYSYNLTLKGKDLVVSSVSVTQWTEGGFSDIEI